MNKKAHQAMIKHPTSRNGEMLGERNLDGSVSALPRKGSFNWVRPILICDGSDSFMLRFLRPEFVNSGYRLIKSKIVKMNPPLVEYQTQRPAVHL